MMYEKHIHFISWMEENIHPAYLHKSAGSDDGVIIILEAALSELKLFKKSVFKRLVISKREAIISVRQVVHISNIVHSYLHRYKPLLDKNGYSLSLRPFYIKILGSIEKVIDEIKSLVPDVCYKIPITFFAIKDTKIMLKSQFNHLVTYLDNKPFDENLKVVIKDGIRQIIFKTSLTHREVSYCVHLMKTLVAATNADNSSLLFLLVENGFNYSEFYIYNVELLKKLFDEKSGFHDQLELLINEKEKLKKIPVGSNMKMLRGMAAIKTQLHSYLKAKERHTEKMLNVKRSMLRDDQLLKSAKRQLINLPVAQLALFIRVQLETGILMKENVGELFSFFTEHFYTPKTTFISGESLRKKSTEVEFSTAQKLKSQLIAMLNWINENYNLSKYN